MFLLSKIAGDDVLIPVGKASVDFNKIISLNELGTVIWKLLEEETTAEKIVDSILKEYDVDRDTATADTEAFLSVLRENGCITEE